MPRPRNDHEIKFMGDAELYLALKGLADEDDRSFSDYLRHVLKCHVRQVVSAQDRRQAMPNLGIDMADLGGSAP